MTGGTHLRVRDHPPSKRAVLQQAAAYDFAALGLRGPTPIASRLRPVLFPAIFRSTRPAHGLPMRGMWLRGAIERYARAHPNASDTADGIAEWWVPHGHRWTSHDLQHALDDLVASAVLRSTTLPGGTVLYSVGEALRR